MFETLTRETIDEHVVEEFGRPRSRDARLRVVELDGRRAVLKDVRRSHGLFRHLFGRRLIAREFRIYQALDGVPGVPRAYRRLDRDAFLVEYVEAHPITRRMVACEGFRVPPAFYDRCMALVGALHDRGVVHFDLRNARNFLIGKDGRAYVVDFASAVRIPAWVPFRRAWIRFLGATDRAGVLKMKQRLSPELLTDADRRALRRFERVRMVLLPYTFFLQAARRFLRRRRRARAKRAAVSRGRSKAD